MGLGPLDWLDSMSWGKSIRRMGEGTPAERASMRSHGIMGVSMPSGMDPDQQTVMAIVAEHAFRDGSMFDPMKARQNGIDQNAAFSAMKWLRNGSQVFDFEAALADELMDTDVDDVPVNDVVLPYESIYIRLRSTATDASGTPYDGFLVERRENDVATMIGVTPIMRQGRGCRAVMLSILPYGEGLTVAEAIAAEAARLANPNNPIQIGGMERPVAASVADAIGGVDGMNDAQSISRSMNDMRDAVLSIEAVMPFIVNALLYIDSCRSHIRRGWPTGAPDKIAARAIAAPKGATKARDTLIRANWREAHLCTLQAEIDSGSVIGDPSERPDRCGPRAHWRRGHWRMQVHGPARSLRRRIRIRPTMIGTKRNVPEHRRYGVMTASGCEAA